MPDFIFMMNVVKLSYYSIIIKINMLNNAAVEH